MSVACHLSEAAARAAIGNKQLSPVKLRESCIARIERSDPTLNEMVIP